jgi:replicative DNA helicase
MTVEQDTLERTPPQAVDVEQAVLGAMLLDRDAIDTATEIIDRECFYRGCHRDIFQAIVTLRNSDVAVDLVTVSDELAKEGKIDEVGGRSYLVTLTELVATAANIGHHCRIVREKATIRQLQDVATGIVGDCYHQTKGSKELLDQAEEQIFRIQEHSVKRNVIQLGDVLLDSYHNLTSKERITGLATGFGLLDYMTRGLHPGQLIIIGGRPSHGKTSLALNIIEHVATGENPVPVGFFSLETTSESIGEMLISARARISPHEAKSDREFGKLGLAMKELEETPIYIDDSPTLTPLEIKAKARRLKSGKDIGLLVLDYLQLVTVTQYKERRDQVGYASRCLKQLAKELNIPIIGLSQLNRACEARPDKRPQLADLRETGEVEQDADLVLMVYRPSRYEGLMIKTLGQENRSLPAKEYSELIIRKQKRGPIGSIELFFHEEYTRFDNVSQREEI